MIPGKEPTNVSDKGDVVLDDCAAVRGILNDDQGGPLRPPGLRMAEALSEVHASLQRNVEAKKGGAEEQLQRLASLSNVTGKLTMTQTSKSVISWQEYPATEGFAVSGSRGLFAGPHGGHHSPRRSAQSQDRSTQPQLQTPPLSALWEICARDRVFTRILHDLGDLVSARPRDIHLVYSQHHCTAAGYFNADTSDYALPNPITPIASFPWPCDWSSRTACRIKPPVGIYGATIAFLSLSPPSRTGWRPGEKKAARQMDPTYLDWALADFSGYIAIDELYDGPFCVLSIVDNRTFKRLIYQVLDHDPEHPGYHRVLPSLSGGAAAARLGAARRDHGWFAPLSGALAAVFGDVPHQICEFHVLKELTKAILRAVAKVRKQLAAPQKPLVKRGRPSTTAANEPPASENGCNRKSLTSLSIAIFLCNMI